MQKPVEITQLQNAVQNLKPTTVGLSNRGGVAFYSILKATEKVPYDSAVLLFTGRAAEDEDLALIASENIASKRCKVSDFRTELHDLERAIKQWGAPAPMSLKAQSRVHFAQNTVQFAAALNTKLPGLKSGGGGGLPT